MSFSSAFIESTLNKDFQNKWAEENSEFLNTPHAFLSSFPRSGNGWVRLILASAFLRPNDVDVNKLSIRYRNMERGMKYSCLATENSEYSIEEIFPDIYHLNLKSHYSLMSDTVKSLEIPIKLIKTHHIVNSHSTKTIFLFREPLACLTSAALFFNKNKLEEDPASINSTIQYLEKFYSEMLAHYLNQSKENPQNILFVSHKNMLNRGVFEIERIFNFLGIKMLLSHLDNIFQCFPFKSTYAKAFEKYMTNKTKEEIIMLSRNEYSEAERLSNLN